MAKKTKKSKFSCWHAHDYSTIELNGEQYLDISNPEPLDNDPRRNKMFRKFLCWLGLHRWHHMSKQGFLMRECLHCDYLDD